MKRRRFVKDVARAACSITLLPLAHFEDYLASAKPQQVQNHLVQLEKLKSEKPVRANVRVERGGPRLFLNGTEIYPLLALSTHMYPTVDNFRQAGIHIYQPILGMRSGWLGKNEYDWTLFDAFLSRILEINPQAYFLPRMQLNTPNWWKEAHPAELLQFGLKTPSQNYNLLKKRQLKPTEGGFYFGTRDELWEASFASEVWRRDTGNMLKAFATHIAESPLRSRVIGYMPTTGRTGEWNTYGPEFLPDYSQPMKQACGEIPDRDSRLKTTFGLLRDPQKERSVINFYQNYHNTVADTAIYMCRALQEATDRQLIIGVFYGYMLEQVRIQEGGYLAMQKFLESPDIDYIAGPYSYMPGNVTNEKGVRYATQDGAGNILGNARGTAGDGGFRVLTESLRRHNKLYFSEMDPSTHLDKNPLEVYGGHGGEGSDTISGSLHILQRDLGQVFACGIGGWLYDFGPLNQAENGWYAGKTIIGEIARFVQMGELRPRLNIAPVAEIAAVYDDQTFSATEHWLAAKPWDNYAIKGTDFFNHWFLNAQVRAFHRIGAPMDFLFHRDLTPEDAGRYKLIFMVNNFMMDDTERKRIQNIFRNSGTTVVWYYAPGFISPEKLDLKRMEQLTGFQFEILTEPGLMLIQTAENARALPADFTFGIRSQHWPRFAVTDADVQIWGQWADTGQTALAGKAHDGYFSVYTGTAPLPNAILRRLAQRANTPLWSSEPDIIRATEDAVMIVATSSGKRRLTLPKSMTPVEGGPGQTTFDLVMEKGEVKVFVNA